MAETNNDLTMADTSAGEHLSANAKQHAARLLWLLFSHRGRISRGVFFCSGLLVYGLPALTIFLVAAFFESGLTTIAAPLSRIDDSILEGALFVAVPPFIWINWMISLKRFHDFGRGAGTMILVWIGGAIPYIGFVFGFIPLAVSGTDGPNEFGPGPGWRNHPDQHAPASGSPSVSNSTSTSESGSAPALASIAASAPASDPGADAGSEQPLKA